jgi:hypothetical protein
MKTGHAETHMLQSDQIEELINLVWSLDRSALVRQFHEYPGRFPIDFTDEFFKQTPVDRLRHIFVAMCMQNQRMPVFAPSAA